MNIQEIITNGYRIQISKNWDKQGISIDLRIQPRDFSWRRRKPILSMVVIQMDKGYKMIFWGVIQLCQD